MYLIRMIGTFVVLIAPELAAARGTEAARCDRAAEQAARATGVPVEVLWAITRVETGRSIEGELIPWPWTVNEAGAGAWYGSEAEAVTRVSQAMAAGDSNIDIGCFQVNLHWHGKAFPSLRAMFEPDQNALYAADFLQRLYGEYGDWEGAIGAYHSRKAVAASNYMTKVAAAMGARPSPPELSNVRRSYEPRPNGYPLLQQGGDAGMGSLFANDFGHLPTPLIR